MLTSPPPPSAGAPSRRLDALLAVPVRAAPLLAGVMSTRRCATNRVLAALGIGAAAACVRTPIGAHWLCAPVVATVVRARPHKPVRPFRAVQFGRPGHNAPSDLHAMSSLAPQRPAPAEARRKPGRIGAAPRQAVPWRTRVWRCGKR